MSAPPPLDREPRSVRPPFTDHDTTFDHLMAADTDTWRRAVQLDREAALREPLAGLELSVREHRIVEWLAGWDVPTIAPLVRILHAARAAAPLTEGGPR